MLMDIQLCSHDYMITHLSALSWNKITDAAMSVCTFEGCANIT